MATKIRLKRAGTTKKPRWRIVVAHGLSPREGRAIEELGTYDPTTNPVGFKIKLDRYKYWVGVGAKASDTIRSLVKRHEKAGA